MLYRINALRKFEQLLRKKLVMPDLFKKIAGCRINSGNLCKKNSVVGVLLGNLGKF